MLNLMIGLKKSFIFKFDANILKKSLFFSLFIDFIFSHNTINIVKMRGKINKIQHCGTHCCVLILPILCCRWWWKMPLMRAWLKTTQWPFIHIVYGIIFLNAIVRQKTNHFPQMERENLGTAWHFKMLQQCNQG